MKPAICSRLIACLAAMNDVASSYQYREPFIINQINYTMKRFEYRTLDVSANRGFWGGKVDIQELTDELNRLGREGWEIASSVDMNWGNGSSRNVLIMLKREVS